MLKPKTPPTTPTPLNAQLPSGAGELFESGAAGISDALALVLITLYALPLFLVCLGTGEVRAMMELFNLVPVREAFRDHHWLLPTLGGLPRMVKPPLPVWIPAATARLFGTDNLWVVRLPSVLLAIFTCWATYAIGCATSRDRRVGLFAAIALAGMVVFIRQARLASYDIYATAFCTIGFWALLLMVQRRRWWLWAMVGGAALGLSVLSKGPVPPMYVLLPFGLWLLAYHRKNWRVWAGLGVALTASIVVFMPWLVLAAQRYALEYHGNAWAIWTRQFVRYAAASGPHFMQTNWYYLAMLGWVYPWTPALVAGLLLPFLPSRGDPQPSTSEKRGRLLFWLVLVLGLLLLTLPHQKKQRYALQQFPFAALLIGALWQEFCRLKSDWPLELPSRILLAVQAILTAGAGLVMGALIPLTMFSHAAPAWAEHYTLMESIAMLKPALQVLGWWGWLLTSILLVLTGVWLWRDEFSRRFGRAFLAYAVGTWILMLTVYWAYFAGAGYQVSPYRIETRQLVGLADRHTIYTLAPDQPWLGVLYYANEIMPTVSPARLEAVARSPRKNVYVLTRDYMKPYSTILNHVATTTGRTIITLDRIFDGHVHQDLVTLQRP